jgi:hypothetical protein
VKEGGDNGGGLRYGDRIRRRSQAVNPAARAAIYQSGLRFNQLKLMWRLVKQRVNWLHIEAGSGRACAGGTALLAAFAN